MTDKFNLEAAVNFTTQNADTVEKSLKSVQDLIVALGESGKISEKTMKSLFLSVERQMDSLGKTSSQSLSRQSQGWKQLQAEIRKTTQEIQENAKASVLQGSKDPLRSAVNQMPLGQAQTIVAADEAANATALSISRKRIEMEQRLQDARRESIRLDREATDALHPLETATERLTAAQARLVDAENRVSRAETGGDLQEQVRAHENLVKAKHEVSDATSHLTRVQEENVAGLPRLRYAMYDVAQTTGILTAAIGGLATGLITASAQYETAFTAVERTSGVTGDAVGKLRDDFLQLAREIPQTFAEISNIGARGAQLGVATDQLDDFTKVVAQFVATSDTVTLDQAVEAFGRISNLLGDTDFNRIGSAITLVGVNAAATEAQIVRTTQELAPFATAVGMSTEGVIALATALGSLGQPPERARSAFLTLQRVMDNAIASGSDNLYAFANLLNKTAEETAALWKQDPDAFITAFARSLSSVEDLTTAFAELGINERRAVQVFQALAADARNAGGELSVLERAMKDAAQGYAEGTELARQYGLIVDDLASKWQIFKNSVMELSATLGDTFAPIAKSILDIITPIIQHLTEMSKTPAGRALVQLSGVVAGLTFALGTLITTLALGIASIAAMRTAMDGLTRSAGMSVVSFKTLRAEVASLAGSIRGGTTALKLFRGALISTGIGAAILLVGSLAQSFTNLGESVEDTFNKYVSSTGGLAEALAADAELFNQLQDFDLAGNGLEDMFVELPALIDDTTGAVVDNTEAFEAAQQVLGLIPSTVDQITGSMENQTIVLGDNTRAWIANSLLTSQAFQELMKNTAFVEAWRKTGADFNEVINAAAADGVQGVYNYFNSLGDATSDAAGFYATGLEKIFIAIENGFKIFARGISSAWDSLMAGDFSGAWNSFVASSAGIITGAFTAMSTPLSRTSREMASLAAGAVSTARSIQDLTGGVLSASDAFDDFGSATENAGGSLNNVREEVRTVLDYASDLQGVFNRAFDLRFGVSIAQDNTANMLQKMRDEAEAARDRIRDLQSSLRDLRAELGLIDADISKTQYFLSIAVEYGDTKRAEQLQAQLAKLEADRAKTQENLRKTQRDLNKEQEANSKTTQGNSQAARDNRKALQDLFQSYQAQIVAYAEAGASQEELDRKSRQLREEFVRQATQLGYNRRDVQQYEKAFNDLTIAIRNVPRNVTLEVRGLNPAVAALREFETRVKTSMDNARRSVGRGVNIPVSTSFNDAGFKKMARGAALAAQLEDLLSRLASAQGEDRRWIGRSINDIRHRLATGNYYTGGFTGRGGKYEPAGIVHKGEYVIPKHMVNQSTGLPYADALGRLVKGTPSPAGYARGGYVRQPQPGTQTVALTPGTIQAIAQATNKEIILDGQVLAHATERAYSRDNTNGAW